MLTYHRSKQKREVRCPQCKDEMEKAIQTCYWCGHKFTDADGMLSDDDEVQADLEAMFRGKATEEEKAKALEAHRKAVRKRGAIVTKGKPIKREDWAEFKAKHFGKGE